MFTILGADGKEYGPVPAHRVHEWIHGGRANLQTKARREGEADWKTLGDFPEFNPALAPAAPPPALAESAIPSPAATGVALAGRGARLGSFFLDYLCGVLAACPGLIILGPTFLSIFMQAARGQEPDFSGMQAGGMLLGVAVTVLGSLILLIIQIVMLSTRGQTIGKRLVGIRVVRHPDASPAGFVHAWLLRNLVPGILQLLPFGLGFLFFLVDACFIFREDRRCIHDFIAGTQVVKA
jgi:uncharacterized RDD family membrane protein YckC